MGISLEQPVTIDFMTVPFGGAFVKITIRADAFLRHMVRNIVGTLVEIGRGRMKSGDIREILAALDRRRAGPTAPARGLFLERIFYD
jgi:tRNA pseudouridine38-40 synthase